MPQRTGLSERLITSNVQQGRLTEWGIQLSEQIQAYPEKQSSWCCFSEPEGTSTNLIPFNNILWACRTDEADVISVEYVVRGSGAMQLRKIAVELLYMAKLGDVESDILAKAYGSSIIQPKILIILNNHGGQGKALELYRSKILPVVKAARAEVDFLETKYEKHGMEIGRTLDEDKYDIVACCSGDGIPHEVMNGAYLRLDSGRGFFSKIALTQLPCGSGNALSLSTHGTNDAGEAAFQMLKSQKTKMDVMAVSQAGHPTRLSFLSQTYGAIADADIGTEHLRWMGPVRFELGVLAKMIAKLRYPCELWVKYEKTGLEVRAHFDQYAGKVNKAPEARLEPEFSISEPVPEDWTCVSKSTADRLNIFYVGNLPYMLSDAQFFPAALPNDGYMDMVLTDTSTPFTTFVKLLTSIDSGAHVNLEYVEHAKISAYRLVPKVSGNHYILIDGEQFPFEPLQVEVLPQAVSVLLQKGGFVDTCYTNTAEV